MSGKTKLKKALRSIDEAKRALNRAKHVDEAYSDAQRAIRELDDAQSDIKKAMRELD